MILEAITLHQVCQHEHLHVCLGPGLIGVLGPNGAGKSNFVNMIKASITGDFSATPGVKDDNIRWGIKDGDYSAVTATWQHDGKKFTVRRALKNISNSLTGEGVTEELRNVREINAHIERLIGFSKNVMNFMFVPQWEMFSFISDDHTKRNATFSHLCGTAVIGAAHNAISKRIAADLPLVESVRDNREEIAERIQARVAQINELKEQLSTIKASILDSDLVAGYERAIEASIQYETLQRSLTRTVASLATAKADATQKTALYKTLTAKQQEHETALAAAKSAADAGSSVVKAAESYRLNKARIEELRTVIAKAKALKEPPEPSCFSKRDKYKTDALKLSLQIEEVRRLIAVGESDKEGNQAYCPTCGTELSAIREKVAKAKEQLPALLNAYDKCNSLIQSCDNHDAAIRTFSKLKLTVDTNAANARAELSTISDVTPVPEAEEQAAIEAVSEYNRALELLNGHKRRTKQAATNANAAVTVYNTLLKEKQAMDSDMQRLALDAANSAVAKEALDKHRTAVTDRKIILARINDLATANKVDHEEIDRVALLIERSQTAVNWLSDLTKVKEFSHKDEFPKLAAQRWLELVSATVNETLAEFDSPFYVETGDDLTFVAVKPSGRREPAERLSGGEKMLLSLSFRFAVNKLLMGDVGIMILDEPTAGVDKANVGHMADIFLKVGAYAKSKGAQLIVITHDESLQRAFNQTVMIGRPS